MVQVYLPEDTSGSAAKTVLLSPDDSTESLIEKINNKLRVENGAGILSIKPDDGDEITLQAGESPFDVWSKYGASGCQVWFRPRDADGEEGNRKWDDDFDNFGFAGLRMLETNETADQFDELLSQLRIDEMTPMEVQEADNTVDTENLPHCSSCGGPIVGQVLIAFNMPWHPEHLGCAVCGTPFTGGKRVMEGEDGNAYCERDFIDTFAVKCGKCSEPIIGECVNALGVGYHPEHFCCEMCGTAKPLEGAFFGKRNASWFPFFFVYSFFILQSMREASIARSITTKCSVCCAPSAKSPFLASASMREVCVIIRTTLSVSFAKRLWQDLLSLCTTIVRTTRNARSSCLDKDWSKCGRARVLKSVELISVFCGVSRERKGKEEEEMKDIFEKKNTLRISFILPPMELRVAGSIRSDKLQLWTC